MSDNQLLIITPNWPAPNYSAAGVRLMQLVEFFKKENYRVTIASTAENSMVKESDFDGIERVSIRLNHSSFDEFVSKLGPDLVLFDRFMTEEQFGWRVAQHVPNAVLILDTEDLHSLRDSRERALKEKIDFSKKLWLENDMTKREVASIYRSDLSLIISSYEMKLLTEATNVCEALLLHLPFMVDQQDASVMEEWTSFEDRKDFVFIGFGGHAPNIDAISYLNTTVWPLVRAALPEANLNIYGGNLPKKVYQMHNPEAGLLIKGWVEDAKKVIGAARVMLAPLRFGAGLKGKLVDAMRYGTPSVTTSIGAEGMHDALEWNGIVCDDAKSLAIAAIESYQNEMAWKSYQKNGLQILKQLYEKERHEKRLKATLTQLQEKLSEHREKNFIGTMLRHQSLQSTKYLSKWIAEKNRNK
jgi:glycosyltransferase involved in cell wall biosynthesis